ncbi:dihydroxyacetone kinase [Labrys miyagiensis]|uniref:Dihydroxyacetone kinase n=1 Tax=Labrys miyagiensis TaxID=346912 RepID=A0ABQ6CQ08_9HYPH|nr:dihydroxyacetone kinase family protein [Labrys miyagiensis]GLS22220.1 dihydroxyacetone kinase [Labrys miyagiensis]
MKKLINNPRDVVREMLEGAVALAPGRALLDTETVIIRYPLPVDRPVAVLSGGGSGHEPAHAGYVGEGMLTAAVAGDVFTSPSADAVLAGIKAVAGPAGAVLIVKNYTGDRLNFGLAAEMARTEGIPVEVVVVADDVALRNTVERDRRRGIAGTVLVHKIVGAAALSGKSIEEVAELARAAAREIGSMGVALGPCTLPAVGRPGFLLAEDEIELGLGIHGEAGVKRSKLLPADQLVETMLATIAEDLGLTMGDCVVLLVNGLGATPPMELDIITRAALTGLRQRGLDVARAWSGTFLSALDMPGCSLSIFRVNETQLALLDAPTDAPAWPGKGAVNFEVPVKATLNVRPAPQPGSASLSPEGERVRSAAMAAAGALIAAEATLTDLDTKAGDGDLGSSMARGAAAIQALPSAAWQSPSIALSSMGDALRRSIAGSSGPFYATALLRASRHIADNQPPTSAVWAEAFQLAVEAISDLGGARPGDRTMLDALKPAANAFSESISRGHSIEASWNASIFAAQEGARATAAMKPRLGRASYLGDRAVGVPDGGAIAASIWIEALGTSIARR